MTYDNLDAFVLHRRPYRETSFLVDIFSREMGRISFVAKGVRNSKNANRSVLQPFVPVQISLVGRHELKNLKQVESTGRAFQLQGSALFCAMYLNELLQRLLPLELAVEPLFDAYVQSLQALLAKEAFEPLLREYELLLLSELGYQLDFGFDAQTQQPLRSDTFYCLDVEQGFVLSAVQRATVNDFRGDWLMQIGEGQWTPEALRSAKFINRIMLKPLLGNKPLKSRELFQTN
ncbi:DNA repair protein RecO [Bowmanella yangjiangensis]|uniref:DNA repair protein RecO n=1 Tax=Bowmanella yangjiangensis TaxID=2811230 RepID=A0ABS3CQ06_9ALTE|nr:DNA repair protein RecO [Bowmanella yangjiangensis]MBN7818365.1 DNA repair protein RecO [Bowmanella yangjiangensis]